MMSAAYIQHVQVHFRQDLIMEANTMNPDQTAPREQSDLGPIWTYSHKGYIRTDILQLTWNGSLYELRVNNF